MVGAPSSAVVIPGYSSSSAIILSYLTILGTGTQSVTADRDTRCSDSSNEYKGVRQQDIIKR